MLEARAFWVTAPGHGEIRAPARLVQKKAILLEAGQIERDGVGADRNRRKPVTAAGRGHGSLRLKQRGAGDGDGDAWQHRTAAVRRFTEDFARAHLRSRRHRSQRHQQTHTYCPAYQNSTHTSSRMLTDTCKDESRPKG